MFMSDISHKKVGNVTVLDLMYEIMQSMRMTAGLANAHRGPQ